MASSETRFQSLAPELADEWDALVKQSDDGWPFALACWQRLILAVREWGLSDCSFALRENGKLVAVMPLQFNSKSRVMASSGWGGSGPVVAPGLSRKHRHRVLRDVLGKAESLGRDNNAERLEFWTSPVTRSSIAAPWGVNPFLTYGYEDSSGVSQVINLAMPETELWGSVSETARHAIRRARASGCTVARESWPGLLDAYYETHVATYRRTGVAPHPKEYFAGIARELWPRGYGVLWVARDMSGVPIAFHNAIWFGESAFYHTACSGHRALDAGANYLLFWDALIGAKAAGVRWYDCGEIFPSESSDKRAGLTTFKTKFGGEMHRFFKCSKRVASESSEKSEQKTMAARVFLKLRSVKYKLLG